MFNNNEKNFIDLINKAKTYVKGELELNCVNSEWYAMDYRKDWESAIPIETKPYNKLLITVPEAKTKDIDIIKCCDECEISYVE